MQIKPIITVIGLSGESHFFDVASFPHAGETTLAHHHYEEPGGKGFNQAVALGRFDTRVQFITFVGNDSYASIIEKTLEANRVIPFVLKIENQQTAVASIITNKNGDNVVIVHPGVTNQLNGEMLKPFTEQIKKSSFLLMQLEYPLSMLEEALKIAKENNIKTIINPAPFNKDAYQYLLQADLITPNELEAKMLFDLPLDASLHDLEAKILDSAFKQMVVTLGDQGALVYQNKTFIHIHPLTVKPEYIIDTTGAGDAFNGALVYQLSKGIDLVNASRFASIAGGLSVQKRYCLNAFPTTSEVEKKYSTHEKEDVEPWN